MDVQLPVHIDKPAFLAWVQGREERYELAEGRVVMMVGASRAYGIIVRNLVLILHGQLDPHQWTVISEFGLDAGPETLRFPDVVVDRAGGGAGDYVATAPVLVFAQSGHMAYVWTREADGFKPAPTVIVGRDKIIKIAALNLALPFGAVYAGLENG